MKFRFGVHITPFLTPASWEAQLSLLPESCVLPTTWVLFQDELPEFRRSTLEVMRQPLEHGKVTVSRVADRG